MTKENKQKFSSLLSQIFIVHAQMTIVQISPEKQIEEFGMSSDEAVEAAQMHSRLSLQYFQLEDKMFELLDKDEP